MCVCYSSRRRAVTGHEGVFICLKPARADGQRGEVGLGGGGQGRGGCGGKEEFRKTIISHQIQFIQCGLRTDVGSERSIHVKSSQVTITERASARPADPVHTLGSVPWRTRPLPVLGGVGRRRPPAPARAVSGTRNRPLVAPLSPVWCPGDLAPDAPLPPARRLASGGCRRLCSRAGRAPRPAGSGCRRCSRRPVWSGVGRG